MPAGAAAKAPEGARELAPEAITTYVRRPLVPMSEEGETPDIRRPFRVTPSLVDLDVMCEALQDEAMRLVPERCPEVVEKTIDGTLVLFPPQANVAFALDRDAEALWRLCDGVRSCAEILREGCSGRGEPTDALVDRFARSLTELHELRVLRFSGLTAGLAGTHTIDLREIPIYVLNLPDSTTNAEFMREQLEERGLRFEFVPAVRSNPRRIGVALAHLKALRAEGVRPPFCVLEDDSRFMDGYRPCYEVPVQTDALYLGVSRFGSRYPGQLTWGAWNHTKYMRFDADYLRPFNMLARHGIVYLSDRFHRNAIDGALAALTHPDTPHPGDVAYAMLQASHLVLTPNEPACYQSEHHGGNHPATKRALHELTV